VLEGTLRVLHTGASWKNLPDRYLSESTCWRRLQLWREQRVSLDVCCKFLSMLDENEVFEWLKVFIDDSFAPAKKRVAIEPTRQGKGTKCKVVVDG